MASGSDGATGGDGLSDRRAGGGAEDEARCSVGGPRPLGAILPRLTRPAFRRRSPAAAQIMADWPAVVGPALAAVTAPRRLVQGTLTLACAGPVALELAHLAPQLVARINAHCGRMVVQRLRFVQAAPPLAPDAPRRAAAGGGPAPGAAAAALPGPVRQSLARVPSEALRAALEKLARGVYRGGEDRRDGDSEDPAVPGEAP
ncbi:DUF721 domain-containing protein [Caldovatus aquaticus]|uniref:DUF721 domain-containing protein n=1 Tax=Caldovatus aquaticus TaxID=2865671 RepID=A0ABS7F378_9PROT|nr:DUF721 domain-containing protein [Caldovatus aquaticus]MBW8269743.1 DUF721 domain-containing protein [Caldovatus aquaticus]